MHVSCELSRPRRPAFCPGVARRPTPRRTRRTRWMRRTRRMRRTGRTRRMCSAGPKLGLCCCLTTSGKCSWAASLLSSRMYVPYARYSR